MAGIGAIWPFPARLAKVGNPPEKDILWPAGIAAGRHSS
jgi:hypothetical protein